MPHASRFCKRMEMSRDTHRERDDHEIFYNILSFERRRQETLPSHVCQKEKRQTGHDHVRNEKSNGEAFKARNDK